MKIDQSIKIKFVRESTREDIELTPEQAAPFIQNIKERLGNFQVTAGIEEVKVIKAVALLNDDGSINTVECHTNSDKLRYQAKQPAAYPLIVVLEGTP